MSRVESPGPAKRLAFNLFLIVVALVVALVAGELIVRLKNSDGRNYHIEMWKYSQFLKQPSENPILGHEHVPGRAARLQNVLIRINDHGLRGPSLAAPESADRRILFLGSSATLGWGVPEADTMPATLQRLFDDAGDDVLVMNAGIGNYNTRRYVELFLSRLTDLAPTDVVVNFYLNDAEILERGGGNFLLRNSQLTVTFWILWKRWLSESGIAHMHDHYQALYHPDHPGFRNMTAALDRLQDYAGRNDIRVYFVMLPEVHDLQNYPYGFAHEIMAREARARGFYFVDARAFLANIEDATSLWAMPGDPHPNAPAQKLFARGLFPILANSERP